MGKKKRSDSFYYENFADCAQYACDAAKMLDDLMTDFHPEKLGEAVSEMHKIEQAGDRKNHEVNDALLTAFITPIEREDIDMLSDALDVVIDRIEGVLHRMYFCNIQDMRPPALEMSKKIARACQRMHELILEFPELKRSKSLRKHIIEINAIEEEADQVFIESMRRLHVEETDPMQVIAWRDVYTFLEYSVDSVEHVADLVDAILIKNS